MTELCPNQGEHSTTRLALHPDGTPMISIGPAVDLSEPSPALDPEHSRQCMAVPPPAAGEVAALVAALRRLAPQNPLGTADPTITRVAELLERQYPQPVPVGERLPGPENCDAEGCIWLWDTERRWVRQCREAASSNTWVGASWLPGHALPLPS